MSLYNSLRLIGFLGKILVKKSEKVNQYKDTRFRTVANAWVRNQSVEFQGNNLNDFPIKCFWMLINDFQ
jgi:hypothetical protein